MNPAPDNRDRAVCTNLISALSEFNADKSGEEVQKLLDSGVDPFEIIENGLMQAMDTVGTRFEEGTYFLPELLLAAKAVEACSALIRPVLTADQRHARGTIVVGTVAGDIHDLGKNLIISTLESAGFRVIAAHTDSRANTAEIAGEYRNHSQRKSPNSGTVGPANRNHGPHGGNYPGPAQRSGA